MSANTAPPATSNGEHHSGAQEQLLPGRHGACRVAARVNGTCGHGPLRRGPGSRDRARRRGGEPGVYVVGGAVRDALLGRRPARARPRRRGRRRGGRAAGGRAGGRRADRPRALRHRDRARRRLRLRPGRRAPRDLRAAGRAARTSSWARRSQEDLARRDFTVNAIAVRLADGALTTWPGAREDLDAGVLRVLHDRSFVDDPTRMLRLVRYAARLEFAPDPDTEALIDPALLRDRDRRPRGQRAAAAAARAAARGAASCSTATGWAGRCSASASGQLARRAHRPGLLALAACCTASPAKSSPPASTTSASRGRTET